MPSRSLDLEKFIAIEENEKLKEKAGGTINNGGFK